VKAREEFNFSDIFDALIIERDEAKALDLLRRFKTSDILFYHALHLAGTLPLWHCQNSTFFSKEIPLS